MKKFVQNLNYILLWHCTARRYNMCKHWLAISSVRVYINFFLLSYKRSIKLSVVPQLKDKDLFIYAVNLLNLIL